MAVGLIIGGFLYERKLADKPSLVIHGKTYALEVESTEGSREKGLSGRDALAEGSAMLFRFPNPEQQCFWMKDMRFSIDIVWLNAQDQVIKIEKNLTPDTYPQEYCSEQASSRVIELPAGSVDRDGLKLHQTVTLHNV